MTSNSGVLVLILIASGCLSKACGDGQINASPRSSEGEPTPDQPNVEEPVSGVTDVPSTVQPYAHVSPSDIGVSIGAGAIGAYPTEPYTGSCTPAEGATIENKVITCDTLKIYNDNITIRNSDITVTTTVGFRIGEGGGSRATGFTLEYSDLNHTTLGKTFQAFDGSGNGDYRNTTIRKNWIQGGTDSFYIEGDWDGAVIEDNVFGPLAGTDDSDHHADGFQMAEVAGISGDIVIRGNYWDPQSWQTKTAILFASGPSVNTSTVTFENNYLTVYGARTLWCLGPVSCTIRYNIYSPLWESAVGNRCNLSQCDGGGGAEYQCCGYPTNAVSFGDKPTGEYTCNRYASDGDFIEQKWVSGITHNTTGCPSYTP